MRIFKAHRSVCSTVASSPLLAVQLAELALTACTYCQNHPLTLSVDVIGSASAGAAQHGTCVNQFLHFSQGIKRTSWSLHHWCNTPLSGAPIALCRYSCLQLASTPLAVAPTACSAYCELDSFTHPWEWRPKEVLWHPMRLPSDISRPTQCCPRHLSPHLRPPQSPSPPSPTPQLPSPESGAPLRALAALLSNPKTFDREKLAKARACRQALREAQARDPPPPRRLTKAEPRGPRPLTAKQRVRKLLKARKTPKRKER